jgi:hypothetical protein
MLRPRLAEPEPGRSARLSPRDPLRQASPPNPSMVRGTPGSQLASRSVNTAVSTRHRRAALFPWPHRAASVCAPACAPGERGAGRRG